MKKFVTVFVVLVVLLVVFFLLGPFFIVEEGEQAVVVRFGKIVSSTTEAGLHFKTPMVDNVVKYSKKILSWDGEPRRLPTKENQFIWVDTTARWRITDPVKFYSAVNTMNQGYARLDDVIDSNVRTVVARYALEEAVRNTNFINERGTTATLPTTQVEGDDVVAEVAGAVETTRQEFSRISKGRRQLAREILDLSREITPQYGIELIDIVMRQIRYSEELTESVYDRMIAERKQIAQQFRSIGEGAKQTWLGKLENERQSIMSRAYEQTQRIKGTAEARVTATYANAYNQDREFFDFWRGVESYRKTFPKFKKTLSTDMDYFKFLYDPNGE